MAWPVPFLRFLDRPVPKFCHLAAAMPDRLPFGCRVYAIRLIEKLEALDVYILRSQWQRIESDIRSESPMAALLTSGVDNESYQVKGVYTLSRPLDGEDTFILKKEQETIRLAFPEMTAPFQVTPSQCTAIRLTQLAFYVQTPGASAGLPLTEGGGSA